MLNFENKNIVLGI